jgi:hypothetical protein
MYKRGYIRLIGLLVLVGACQGLVCAADRTADAKKIVTLISKGDIAAVAKYFAEEMVKAKADRKIPQAWTGAVQQLGAFKKIAGTRTDTVRENGKEYDRVFVTCEFEHGKLDVLEAFDSSGKLHGLFFVPAQR